MSLIFQVRHGLGVFVPTDEEAAGQKLAQLRDIAASLDEGGANPKKAIRAIKSMISKDPLFLRGYAVLAGIHDESDDEEESSALYVKGCREALKLMPEGFSGPLDAENSDVQCFLRCHAGYVEALVAKGDYRAALEASRRQLAFDPEDLFERRRELGELAIAADQLEEAGVILREQLSVRPTAHYSLAYLAFIRGDLPLAADHLRRAFILAPYAMFFLTGRLTAPNPFWEAGPEAPDYREDLLFVEMLGGDLWTHNEAAHGFLEWLCQTAAVLRELAAMVTISEKCFYASGDDCERVYKEAEAEFQKLMQGVEEKSSAALLAKVTDPQSGEEMAPWELLARTYREMADEAGEECGPGRDGGDDDDEYEEDEKS